MLRSTRSQGSGVYSNTRTDIVSASMGLSTIITFVAIYLGIIFLISGAAILALKELSESSDNRERYDGAAEDRCG